MVKSPNNGPISNQGLLDFCRSSSATVYRREHRHHREPYYYYYYQKRLLRIPVCLLLNLLTFLKEKNAYNIETAFTIS